MTFWQRIKAERLHWLIACLVATLLVAAWPLLFGHTYANKLGDRVIKISDSRTSASATYNVSFITATPGTLGSIDIQFCSNDPFPNTSCTAPPGFDTSSAILDDQDGATGFSISNNSTANDIILSRTPAAAAGSIIVHYDFKGVINPSTPGTFYARLQTFASNDATGPALDSGGIALAINQQLSVSAEVPPYIIFCTGVSIPSYNCATAKGNYVDFGDLSSNYTSYGTSKMLIATNAKDGYGITAAGTTMTSGNNIISQLGGDVSRPGVSQFGLNLRDNSTPNVGTNPQGSGSGTPTASYNQPNLYRFHSGDRIASVSHADYYRRYTASYIVNVSSGQPPGIYVATITYIALGSF
jgi:hypothetical protein